MGCCASTARVQTTASWRAARDEDAKNLEAALRGASDGHPISLSELTTIVSEPSIVHVMERLRGSGESNDPATIAKLLMSRYDRNHNDALDSNEVETMKRELQELTRAPFSVFLSQATPTAGANMQGVVVLDCSTPLLAESVTATLQATLTVKFTQPVTQRRSRASRDRGRSTNHTVYHPKEASIVVLHQTIALHAPKGGLLEPGLHRWPFAFTLPAEAPETFQAKGYGVSVPGNGERTPGSVSLVYCVSANTTPAAVVGAPENADGNAKTARKAYFAVAPSQTAAYTVNSNSLSRPISASDGSAVPPIAASGIAVASAGCFGASNPATLAFDIKVDTTTTQDGKPQSAAVGLNGAEVPEIKAGHTVRATAKVKQTGGKLVASVRSLLELQNRMRLMAGGCVWDGNMLLARQVKFMKDGFAGGNEVSLVSEIEYKALPGVRCVSFNSPIAGLLPVIQVTLQAPSPHGCASSFLAFNGPVLTYAIASNNTRPGQKHAATASGGASAAAAASGAGAGAGALGVAGDTPAWWHVPTAGVVQQQPYIPSAPAAQSGAVQPTAPAASWSTYTYPGAEIKPQYQVGAVYTAPPAGAGGFSL